MNNNIWIASLLLKTFYSSQYRWHTAVAGSFFWLCSCSKIFESGSGNFLNLRIRLLFRLRLQSSIQPQFTYVLLKKWPQRLLPLLKLKSDSFFTIFNSGFGSGSERKTQNPAGVAPALRIRCHLCATGDDTQLCHFVFVTSLPTGRSRVIRKFSCRSHSKTSWISMK